MYTYLRVKRQLFLIYFIQTSIFSKYFRNALIYNKLYEKWETSCSKWTETEKQEDARTDGWSNRHKAANNHFSKLSNTPKEAGILAQALSSTRPRPGRLRHHSRIPRTAKLSVSPGLSQA